MQKEIKAEKIWCDIYSENIPHCDGRCCHFCDNFNCKFRCERQNPEFCSHLQNDKTHFWTEVFDAWSEGDP